MELKGQIILDNETKELLKEEVREEVINDILQNGNYNSEIVRYLNDCSSTTYANIIKETINNVIDKTDEDDIKWSHDKKLYILLKALRDIFKFC